MTSLGPEDVRTIAALVVLAVLLAVTLGALVLIAGSTRKIAESMHRLHLQQATIVGMLLRAGFRPHRRGKDWFDDGDETRVKGDTDYTGFDWRTPGE